MLELTINALGWATLVALAAWPLVATYTTVTKWVERGLVARAEDLIKRGADSVRQSIHNDARWFSEDPPTMDAIEELARGGRPEDVRARWRYARKPQEGASDAD